MDKKEVESLINQKEGLFSDIYKWKKNLIDRKSAVKYDAEDLWNQTIWDEVIDGRATDKNKKAYVDSHLREAQESVEYAEAIISDLENEVEIINDKLKYLGGVND